MDNVWKFVVALAGVAVTYLFGGWSTLLGILLTFVIIDYLMGVIAAAKEGKLKSQVGLVGIAKKVFIFAIIAVAHQIDTILGESHLFRDATIFFYIANELISIIENAGRIGLPLPEPIRNAVEILRKRNDK